MEQRENYDTAGRHSKRIYLHPQAGETEGSAVSTSHKDNIETFNYLKIKIIFSCRTTIWPSLGPLLGLYLEASKSYHRDICSPVVFPALVTIARK